MNKSSLIDKKQKDTIPSTSTVDELRKAGLSDEQIATGLLKNKQALASGGFNTDGSVIQDQSTDGSVDSAVAPSSVFGGRTKQEVLQYAFDNGATDLKTLKNIADTYDLVTGEGDKTPEQKKQEDYIKAQQFIADNPNATREELSSGILQYTSLPIGDINALFDNSGVMKKKDVPALSDNNLRAMAQSLVKKNTGLFTDSQEGMKAAIQQADNGRFKVNDKEVQLSQQQIDKIKSFMKQDYPEGRTFLQKILPWGK